MKVYGIWFPRLALLHSIWRFEANAEVEAGPKGWKSGGRSATDSSSMNFCQSQALYQLFPSAYIGLLLLLFNERVGRALSYRRYP